MEGLGVGLFKGSHRYGALDSQGLSKRLYALNFVHGLRSEVRLAAIWARPQWNSFDYEEIGAFAEASGHVLELD
jgi:hypothetical protein